MRNIPVDVKSADEPWLNIRLVDGSTIMMRVIVMSVDAIYDDNGNQMRATDGTLMYTVNHSVVCKTISSPTYSQSSEGAKN